MNQGIKNVHMVLLQFAWWKSRIKHIWVQWGFKILHLCDLCHDQWSRFHMIVKCKRNQELFMNWYHTHQAGRYLSECIKLAYHACNITCPLTGGALAHAFFPCRGEAHFDMAERWTLHSRKGHNLFMVVAHEIGHTLGLEHSPLRQALMSPYYRKLGKALVLSWDDIIAVQQLYGEPDCRCSQVAAVEVVLC